jgi:hypothetical protein
MTAPVYCERCEFMTHPTLPHSCFSAATLRAHKKVIAAAKAWANDEERSGAKLYDAVEALRAVEGDV